MHGTVKHRRPCWRGSVSLARALSRLRVSCRSTILELMKADIKPRDIMTRAAFENAMTVVMALGGSTNAVLHLLAMARAAGVDLHLDDFQACFLGCGVRVLRFGVHELALPLVFKPATTCAAAVHLLPSGFQVTSRLQHFALSFTRSAFRFACLLLLGAEQTLMLVSSGAVSAGYFYLEKRLPARYNCMQMLSCRGHLQ